MRAYTDLAAVLVAQGSSIEAITYLATSIALYPRNTSALNNWGMAYQRIGKFEDARMKFMEAIEINPKYHKAMNNLGVTYMMQPISTLKKRGNLILIHQLKLVQISPRQKQDILKRRERG